MLVILTSLEVVIYFNILVFLFALMVCTIVFQFVGLSDKDIKQPN